MKKLFLIAGIALLPAFVLAQDTPQPTENNPFITDTAKNVATEQYCVVTPHGSGQIRLSVDFGDALNKTGPYYVLGNDRKQMKFNSIVDGLNYMARQGWVFVSTIVEPNKYTSYVLRKVLVPKGTK